MFHTIDEALEDLKAGKVIIVVDDEDRENEGDFVVLAEHATPDNINFMAVHGRGLICTPLSPALANVWRYTQWSAITRTIIKQRLL